MDAEELKARTKKFALRVMTLIDELPNTTIMTASHKTAQNNR
jgi:hypothetical protein